MKLTTVQRRRITEGNYPTLHHEEALPAGQRVQVGDQLHIVVTSSKKAGDKGWRIGYAVEDYRPRLLKDSPFAGYTQAPALALRQEPEAVSAEDEAHITAIARGSATLQAEQARAREVATKDVSQSLQQALAQAKARGIDTSSVEHITQRQVERLQRRLNT